LLNQELKKGADMATLSPEQLDELVLHLVIRRSNAKEGSDEYNAAGEALRKLKQQYPAPCGRAHLEHGLSSRLAWRGLAAEGVDQRLPRASSAVSRLRRSVVDRLVARN
jgi:hypothetical protein